MDRLPTPPVNFPPVRIVLSAHARAGVLLRDIQAKTALRVYLGFSQTFAEFSFFRSSMSSRMPPHVVRVELLHIHQLDDHAAEYFVQGRLREAQQYFVGGGDGAPFSPADFNVSTHTGDANG